MTIEDHTIDIDTDGAEVAWQIAVLVEKQAAIWKCKGEEVEKKQKEKEEVEWKEQEDGRGRQRGG